MVGLELLAGEDGGLQVLGDTAYGTGQARADLAAAGHTAIIKPGPLQAGGRRRVHHRRLHRRRAGRHGDLPERRDPAHHRRPQSHLRRRLQELPAALAVHGQRQGPHPGLHRHDALLRQARRDWATRDDLRDAYRQHRPMVERSIAWLIGPKNRCRQLRYRGVSKNNQWLHLRMTALNLRRMINLGLQPGADGSWIIPGAA